MLPAEIATHLQSSGLGLTLGTNLFYVPFPDTAPTDQVAVCIVERPGGEGGRTFGAGAAALVVEEASFLVMVRGARDGAVAARSLAEQVRAKLDFGEAVLSGTRYLSVRPERPVYGPAYGPLELPVFYVEALAEKEPSA